MTGQKWADLGSTTAFDRATYDATAATISRPQQLADGTLIWIEYNGTNALLKYSSDHVTTNTIATLVNTSFAPSYVLGFCLDSSGNIYVIGCDGPNAGQCFTKGSGYSWTAKTVLTTTSLQSPLMSGGSPVWVNDGGGTGGAGHILFGVNGNGNLYLATFDAGAMKAGTGTLFVGSLLVGGVGPGALVASSAGATTGFALMGDNTNIYYTPWSVSSAGAITGTANTLFPGMYASGGVVPKVACVRVATGTYVAIVPSSVTTGGYMAIAYVVGTGWGTAVDSGSPTNMPLNSHTPGWDVFCDPTTADKVWVITTGTLSGTNLPVWRLSLTVVGTAVTWATAATADDTLGAAAASTYTFSVVAQPTGPIVDWMVTENAGSSTYYLLGDNTNFLVTVSGAGAWAGLFAATGTGSTFLSGAGTLFASFGAPDVGITQVPASGVMAVTYTATNPAVAGGVTVIVPASGALAASFGASDVGITHVLAMGSGAEVFSATDVGVTGVLASGALSGSWLGAALGTIKVPGSGTLPTSWLGTGPGLVTVSSSGALPASWIGFAAGGIIGQAGGGLFGFGIVSGAGSVVVPASGPLLAFWSGSSTALPTLAATGGMAGAFLGGGAGVVQILTSGTLPGNFVATVVGLVRDVASGLLALSWSAVDLGLVVDVGSGVVTGTWLALGAPVVDVPGAGSLLASWVANALGVARFLTTGALGTVWSSSDVPSPILVPGSGSPTAAFTASIGGLVTTPASGPLLGGFLGSGTGVVAIYTAGVLAASFMEQGAGDIVLASSGFMFMRFVGGAWSFFVITAPTSAQDIGYWGYSDTTEPTWAGLPRSSGQFIDVSYSDT